MAAKVKELEPTTEQVKASDAATPVEVAPSLVYLVGKCNICGTVPTHVQGGTHVVTRCGTCGKVVEQ